MVEAGRRQARRRRHGRKVAALLPGADGREEAAKIFRAPGGIIAEQPSSRGRCDAAPLRLSAADGDRRNGHGREAIAQRLLHAGAVIGARHVEDDEIGAGQPVVGRRGRCLDIDALQRNAGRRRHRPQGAELRRQHEAAGQHPDERPALAGTVLREGRLRHECKREQEEGDRAHG